jgi:Na+-transporting methylmalonyl-CoA/oxaloacetate decarboxylase gamma subunit
MKPSLDRAFKLTWLGIGALVLLFLVIGLVLVVSQATRNAGAADEAERIVSEERPTAEEPVAVRYGMPDSIRGTATRIVRVHDGAAQGRRSSYTSSGYDGAESAVNVMFVDADGVRLLLDRPAYIRELTYPGAREENPAMEWISYVIAFDDTDRGGSLDARDAMALYVSDLDGRNLRAVLGPPLRYRTHQAFGPGRILVHALDGAGKDEERMRQRAFIYDVRAGQLSPYAAMDSAAERAGRILRR